MIRAAARRTIPLDPAPRTLADLRRALDEKEKELRAMLARKEELARDLEELGTTIEAMLAGSSASLGRRAGPAKAAGRAKAAANGRRKPRGMREGSLPAVIHAVLERVLGPMRVSEIAQAAVKAGYATKSRNLNILVANRLSRMPDVEKIERGLYQLRRPAGATPAQS